MIIMKETDYGNDYYNPIETPCNSNILTVYKNNLAHGDASTYNYYYGVSTSGNIIYSGQFIGKLDGTSAAGIATVYCDDVEIGNATVDEDGAWSFTTASTTIVPGTHNLTVYYCGNDYYNPVVRGNSKTIEIFKNTPTIGDASSFNIGYGNSDDAVIFSGQFSGKINDVSMANATGAIIYREDITTSGILGADGFPRGPGLELE